MNIIKLQGEEEKHKGIYFEYDEDSIPLGEGETGRVYKGFCVDDRMGHRFPVAIKAMYKDLPKIFVDKARYQASVNINNPFLPKMYGFIEMPSYSVTNGYASKYTRYFLVMELLNGVTLHDLIKGLIYDRDGSVSLEVKRIYEEYVAHKYVTIQYLMSKILSGVNALHAENIILCDFNPTNIIITDDGGIKLIDLGHCKLVESLQLVNSNAPFAVNELQAVYAAPELLLGYKSCLCPSADVYALGVLLFQMCTGKPPLRGYSLFYKSTRKTSLHEIKHHSFRKIVNRATQIIQSKRYSSADEMLDELKRIDFSVKSFNWYKNLLYLLVVLGLVFCVVYFLLHKVEVMV